MPAAQPISASRRRLAKLLLPFLLILSVALLQAWSARDLCGTACSSASADALPLLLTVAR